MSIVKRNGDGKLRLDWNALVTLIVSLLISGAVTGFGSYYAIKYDISQTNYRLGVQEKKTETLEVTVNNMRMKDAGDSADFKNLCGTLNDIKTQLSEIRKDQIKRERKER